MEVKIEIDDDSNSSDEEFNENEGASSEQEQDELNVKDKLKTHERRGRHSRAEHLQWRWKARSHLMGGKLPPGWRKVWHRSGMVMYYHRETNTCTLSRPFVVENDKITVQSLHTVSIPNWAIPCLHYQKQKETIQVHDEEEQCLKPEDHTSACHANDSTKENEDGDNERQSIASTEVGNEVMNSGCKRPHDDGDDDHSKGECLKIPKLELSSGITTPIVKDDNDEVMDNPPEPEFRHGPHETDPEPEGINSQPNSGETKLVLDALLNPNEIHNYCAKLFEFFEPEIKISKRRRKANKKRRVKAVDLLSELVKTEFQKEAVYNCNQIFHFGRMIDFWKCTVMIDGAECGEGYGKMKQEAMSYASYFTIKVLFPKELDKNRIYHPHIKTFKTHPLFPKLFQGIDLHDENIMKLCKEIREKSPIHLLMRCIFMKHGNECSNFISMAKVKKGGSDGNQLFRLAYAEQNQVEAQAKEIEIAKNVAAQILLTKLHPDVTDFSEFVTMYGDLGYSEFLKNMSKQ